MAETETEVSIPLSAIADLMNEAFRLDPDAISELAETRVPCNQALADHPVIQVRADRPGAPCRVGLLGLLNGLTQPTGSRFEGMYETNEAHKPKLIGFRLAPMDTRARVVSLAE